MYKKHLSNISYLRSMRSFVNSIAYAYDYYIIIHTQSKARENHFTNDKAKYKNTTCKYVSFYIVLIRRKFYLINILNPRFPYLSRCSLSLILTSAKV